MINTSIETLRKSIRTASSGETGSMLNRHSQIFVIAVACTLTSLLGGCMVAPLVAAGVGAGVAGVSVYNQLNPEKNVNIEIGEQEARKLERQLAKVKHIAVLASSPAALSFSDTWERAGRQASIINDAGDPASLSISQARTVLTSACKKGVHASAYGRAGQVDVQRSALIFGKAPTTMTADLYIFNCSTRKLESAPVVITFNAIGQDGHQTDRSIGAGIADKLLALSVL
jgi:hypothetical protein